MSADATTPTTGPTDGSERPAASRIPWAAVRMPVIVGTVLLVSVIPPLERLRVSGFGSDDASWQVALRTWRPGRGELFLPENTYVLRMPLFVISDALLPPSRWTIFAIAVAVHAVGLWLIVSFARHAIAETLARRVADLSWRHDLAAVIVCAAYQVSGDLTRGTNAGVTTRNLEAGLYLLALRLGYEVVTGRRPLARATGPAAVALSVGALALNDPLFVYTMVLPFVGVVVAGWVVRRGRDDVRADSRWVSAYALAGSAGWGLFLWRVVHGGLARIAGRTMMRDPSAIVAVIGALSLAIAIGAVTTVVVRAGTGLRRGTQPVPWLTLLALGWLSIVATTYAITTSGSTLTQFRYVVVAFPAVGVAIATIVVTLPRVAFVGVMAVSVAALTVGGTLDLRRDDDDAEQVMLEAADVVERLADDGYDRGYSGYWTSSIVTYLSDSRAPVLPVACTDDGRAVPFEWLVDSGQYDRAAERPGDRSFIIVDRLTARSDTCSDEQIIERHGRPAQVVRVRDELEIWLFPDRDVVAEMIRALRA